MGKFRNSFSAPRHFLKAELALLRTSKAEDIEYQATLQVIEAGLDDTEIKHPLTNPDVPQETHRQKQVSSLYRTARQAGNAYKVLTARRGNFRGTPAQPEGRAIPRSLIQELLCLLDIGNLSRTPASAPRRPARPCPFAAQELYDRLLLAGSRRTLSNWVCPLVRAEGKKGRALRPRPRYITASELSGLLGPVVAEMGACLGYVEAFCDLLGTAGRQEDDWVDLAGVRACVLKLMGFWPRCVAEDDPAYAFALPSDLAMLLYPQICLDREEMVENLEDMVLGPGRDSLKKLQGLARSLRDSDGRYLSGEGWVPEAKVLL